MDPHQLPNDCEHELLVGLEDVRGADANQVDLHLVACIEGDLAVNAHLKHVVCVFFDTVPLNDVRVDFVDDLEQKLTVSALFVQIVDEHTLNVQGVDPQSEGTFLSRALHGIIVDETSSFELLLLFFVQFFKAVLGVENFGYKDRVSFRVRFNEVGGIHDMGYSKSVSVGDQRLGTLEVVCFSDVAECAL